MNEKEKLQKEISSKELYELDLPKFYDTLNKAINSNNIQSIYELSKIFTRYCFKDLDN
ncbi:MAG: hypothetical protein ACFFE5_15920 [Candidatus Thorarchaeota archaeon]